MRWPRLCVALLAACAVCPIRGQAPPPPAHVFAAQGDHFTLDGQPFRILAGELHYARIPREYWRDRLRMAKAMGLNTVATYVFWNVHEPAPGVFEFSGNADVAAFVRLAQAEGLRVLLRAGPYSCAEWELGGFPSWLLATPESQQALRTSDPIFVGAVARWMTRLGRELAPLQIGRGGPIIATQIENEYGIFGADPAYMPALKEIFLRAGFTDCMLYTADNWRHMPNGMLPGIVAGANFGLGNGPKGLAALAQLRPGAPLFVSEYWPGWFDHWGHPHQTRPIEPQLADLEHILSNGAGVNIYMFHGGTSFGFMSGSSWTEEKFLPDVTSYDYDAPLDEAGHPTPKFHAYRALLARYADAPLPDVPAPPSVATVKPFALREAASLWDHLPAPETSSQPLPMERLGQSYGYILYRRTLPAGTRGRLEIDAVHDYAILFLDGRRIGIIDRRQGQTRLPLPASGQTARLDILVENSGRINTDAIMRDERKGITREVRLDGVPLLGWQIYRLPMSEMPAPGRWTRRGTVQGPAFLRGAFTVESAGDVFLDVRALGKGALWVNGHAMGRFWSIGPQQTLFVPGPWLHKGSNDVVVFDVCGVPAGPRPELAGLPAPILSEVHEEGAGTPPK
jgi:beta-galactosidase